ncbi:amino acid ABC transporter permease [Shewanella fidelis]|uniref:Putative glutamine transport system permease protein GlnP n=1 Tax=Shewanella fidelis TaxID=173509 RepID=A0AAW8NL68_9GAMM|nr:amino acid ABC transporter permease [Shewanella fidelis]MDR8522549.1 amino acid ABC transporter permease [Shewanella fidelis]MDW4812917.1 amino acid ABC transporter permease [Shewanella fidelis]MDW4816824.1 amino acid ABC transporter permease [Shewanella fidelis]MDW4820924.1 amino acid ABC transporter permease [Shewanella fidelis]MDW4825541.1 amino acid ABC transporter permease [Shewanella fidelis]
MIDAITTSLFTPIGEDGLIGIYLILNGLKVTLIVTFFAMIMGSILGVATTLMKMSSKWYLSWPANLYVSVIRGTPVVVQLVILYFIVLASLDVDKITAAIIAFGLNSGAYISEIIRAGIQAVDKGQMEAARSLGLSHWSTMKEVILPQAIKNILPSLGNEFIVLLKETAVIGFIGGVDLMRAGEIIRSRTFEDSVPLFTCALIYLLLTYIFTFMLAKFETRLKQSD